MDGLESNVQPEVLADVTVVDAIDCLHCICEQSRRITPITATHSTTTSATASTHKRMSSNRLVARYLALGRDRATYH
eukprot:COSAG02_NODE_14508_length_1264_cov_1.296996_1_plen_76_part_10